MRITDTLARLYVIRISVKTFLLVVVGVIEIYLT